MKTISVVDYRYYEPIMVNGKFINKNDEKTIDVPFLMESDTLYFGLRNLLWSFGYSGNSPESQFAKKYNYKLVNKIKFFAVCDIAEIISTAHRSEEKMKQLNDMIAKTVEVKISPKKQNTKTNYTLTANNVKKCIVDYVEYESKRRMVAKATINRELLEIGYMHIVANGYKQEVLHELI